MKPVLVPIPYSKGDPHIKCGVHVAKLEITREGYERLKAQIEAALDAPKQTELFTED